MESQQVQPQTRTLAELAAFVGGTIIGDSSLIITGVAPTHLANQGELTFLLDSKQVKKLDEGKPSAVLVNPSVQKFLSGQTLLVVDDVKTSLTQIATLFSPPRTGMIQGVSPQAFVAPTSTLGSEVAVGAGAYIGAEVTIGDRCTIYPNAVILDGSTIGEGTVIFPNVVVYENTQIGANCILHASSVIGSYGFGYSSSASGHILSDQLGNVIVEDNVEIGACSTVDRATYGSTRIQSGTKIDNHVQIAHNCLIGKHNLICAHTGIAGSSTTGDFVVMAGRVGIKDHAHIGTGAVLGAMAGVMEDIPAGGQYVGIPATDFKEQFKKQAALSKLPAMRKEFIALQGEVKKLQDQLIALTASLAEKDSHRG